jgi:hypothetical protein
VWLRAPAPGADRAARPPCSLLPPPPSRIEVPLGGNRERGHGRRRARRRRAEIRWLLASSGRRHAPPPPSYSPFLLMARTTVADGGRPLSVRHPAIFSGRDSGRGCSSPVRHGVRYMRIAELLPDPVRLVLLRSSLVLSRRMFDTCIVY